MHRLLLCTLDTDQEFQEFVKETLKTSVLLNKYPNFVLTHFTETIVACNGCTAHPAFQSFYSSAGDLLEKSDHTATNSATATATATAGVSKQSDRFRIYAFLLGTLTSDEQRIHIAAKVSHDILSWAVDNSQQLQPSTSSKISAAAASEAASVCVALESTLRDSFAVLQSPLISVHSVAGYVASDTVDADAATAAAVSGGDGEEEDGSVTLESHHRQGAALLAKAKSKVCFLCLCLH